MNNKQINEVLDFLNQTEYRFYGLLADINNGKWFWQKWSASGLYFFLLYLENLGIVVKKIGDGRNSIFKAAVAPSMLGKKLSFCQGKEMKKGEVIFQDNQKVFINHLEENQLFQTIRYLHETNEYE